MQTRTINRAVFAINAIVGFACAVAAVFLGLAAFAAGSEAGQIAAVVLEVGGIVVLFASMYAVERC